MAVNPTHLRSLAPTLMRSSRVWPPIRPPANARRRGAIDIVPRNWFNPNLIYQWFMVPNLIASIALIIGLIVTALSIARERELGTLDQLMVSPAPHQRDNTREIDAADDYRIVQHLARPPCRRRVRPRQGAKASARACRRPRRPTWPGARSPIDRNARRIDLVDGVSGSLQRAIQPVTVTPSLETDMNSDRSSGAILLLAANPSQKAHQPIEVAGLRSGQPPTSAACRLQPATSIGSVPIRRKPAQTRSRRRTQCAQ